jgi:hypothetical protein
MSGLINTPEHELVWNARVGVLYEWADDCDGRRIKKADYGKYTEYGWQIDHVTPTILGGLDIYANKRPRHWRGNSLAGAMVGNALRRGLF